MQERLQVEAVAAEVERRPEERRHEAVAAEAEGLYNALRSQQAHSGRSTGLAEHQACPEARRGLPSAASATDSASGVPPSPMSHCKGTPSPLQSPRLKPAKKALEAVATGVPLACLFITTLPVAIITREPPHAVRLAVPGEMRAPCPVVATRVERGRPGRHGV